MVDGLSLSISMASFMDSDTIPRLKSPPHRMHRRFGAATLVADSASESIELAIEMESESPSIEEQGALVPLFLWD